MGFVGCDHYEFSTFDQTVKPQVVTQQGLKIKFEPMFKVQI